MGDGSRKRGTAHRQCRAPPVRCRAFFALDLAVWHWSVHYTSVANATLLANLAPVFVALGTWWLLGEALARTFVVGFGCALLGLLLLTAHSAASRHGRLVGDALVTLTAVFYAGYLLTVSRLRRRLTTATVMALSGAATCTALLPAALLSGEAMLPVTATGWTILLGLALLSHVAGQGLIAHALAR